MSGRWTAAVLSAALLLPAPSFAADSKLWNNDGQSWSPRSRLPDFSFAGYRGNDAAPPDFPRVANVRDFGAKGDGIADDSDAFIAALATGREGTIFIPAGRYKLTQQLRIIRRHVNIQGEGPDKTILYFPRSLTDVVGPGKGHAPGGSWSWSGGFVSFEGGNNGEKIARITANAARGTNEISVNDTSRLKQGQAIRIRLFDTDGKLGRRLHADQADASTMLRGKKLVDFPCTITKIQGRRLTLNRPLRVDIEISWTPLIVEDSPSIEDVGIENVSMVFPAIPSAPHHEERGFNAINFEGVTNGWARHIRIENADSGIILRSGTTFCTIEDIEFKADPLRAAGGRIGHHGLLAADLTQDNRFEDFRFQGKFIHDLCVTSMACGNVFMNGQGVDLTFDHHRKAPYENLFTNLDAGKGSSIWYSGGDEEAGPHTGARETFWNIRTQVPQQLPSWAVQINFVAVTTSLAADLSQRGNWIEPIAPEKITPANLFTAQLERRRATRP